MQAVIDLRHVLIVTDPDDASSIKLIGDDKETLLKATTPLLSVEWMDCFNALKAEAVSALSDADTSTAPAMPSLSEDKESTPAATAEDASFPVLRKGSRKSMRPPPPSAAPPAPPDGGQRARKWSLSADTVKATRIDLNSMVNTAVEITIVLHDDSDEFDVTVLKTDKVRQIKDVIQLVEGVPRPQQKLYLPLASAPDPSSPVPFKEVILPAPSLT